MILRSAQWLSLIKVHLSELSSVLESILRMGFSDRQISSPESAGRSDLLWYSWKDVWRQEYLFRGCKRKGEEMVGAVFLVNLEGWKWCLQESLSNEYGCL